MESQKEKLTTELKSFEDWYKAVIFDKDCNIIASKNIDKLEEGELKEFLTALNNRDTTIGKSFKFCGKNFDAHRFHPPLTYYRRGGTEGGKDDAEGICLARINKHNVKYYLIITYVYPIVSARTISIITDFLKDTNFGKLDE